MNPHTMMEETSARRSVPPTVLMRFTSTVTPPGVGAPLTARDTARARRTVVGL